LDEFKELDWQKIYDNMMKPAVVFDGRGIFDVVRLGAIGFELKVIGEE
jgi:UDPglucose 6-dehydrogenase